MNSKLIGIAAITLMLAVILGAFGAHGLKDRLGPYELEVYHKAVFYHFVHGLALLVIPILVKTELLSADAGFRIFLTMILGVLIFSGSLYLLAVTGTKFLGAITPIGGLALIGSWFMMTLATFR